MQRRTLMATVAAAVVLGGLHRARAQDGRRPFTREELDQMLAPIALYPDALLSQILMAATYPLEVVRPRAGRGHNPGLKGDAAVAAVANQDWDVSVKSLAAFPQVLAQMDGQLDWTQKLGDAMLGQQQDVADSIQRLRAEAAAAGNLASNSQQVVSYLGSGDDRMIEIEPANPSLIYVPYYNPVWAYGSWPYAGYPPYYYPPGPIYGYGAPLVSGFMFGIGLAAAGAIFGGWNCNRGHSYVNVNVNRAVSIDRSFNAANVNNGQWQHNVDHRRGVAYRDPATRQQSARPGRASISARTIADGSRAPSRPRRPTRGRMCRSRAARPTCRRPTRVRTCRSSRLRAPTLPQQGAVPRPAAQPMPQVTRGNAQPAQRAPALTGVERGQQVNREATRGRAQQTRAAAPAAAPGTSGCRRRSGRRKAMSVSILRRGLLAFAFLLGLAVEAVAQQPASPPSGERQAAGLCHRRGRGERPDRGAARRRRHRRYRRILGPSWRDFVPASKEDEDRARARYLAGWDANHKVVVTDDLKAVIEAGTTGWTMPIPIVKDGAEWRFDLEAGRKEIVARRIGRNELAVVQTLLAIVDAQREYATLDPMKLGVPAYARRLLSSPGKKDGLYWEQAPGEPESSARTGSSQGAGPAAGQGRAGRGLLRLPFPPAVRARTGGARRRPRLSGQGSHDRRLRGDCLAGGLRERPA